MEPPASAESRPPASEAPRSPTPLAAPPPRRSQTVPLHPEHHVALNDGLARAPPLPLHTAVSKPLPVAPMDLFFTLSAYTPPAVPSTATDAGELAQIRVGSPARLTPIATPGAYEVAIDRINRLTDYLTPVMRASLIATLSVVRTFTTPEDLHPLILRIASPNFSDAAVKSVADIVMSGLSAYEAKGGPAKGSTRTPDADAAEPARKKHKSGDSKASSGRDGRLRTLCTARDGMCPFTHHWDGQVCHIIPFAVKDKKAVDFWKFITLFRGAAATDALKEATLGPYPHSTDTLLNLLVMTPDVHRFFDRAQIAVVPHLTDDQVPYDPQTVLTVRHTRACLSLDTPANTSYQYNAAVEFPFGVKRISIPVWRDEDGDEVYVKRLAPGDTITFRTTNPTTMPLPHPLLFQLHTILARIVAAKARAGFPSFPDDAPDADNIPVLASDSECDGDQSPQVSEAQWMSRPRGAKRKAEEDVEDMERPRKVDVVLGEYEMRMQEKWAIARRRVAMKGAYWAY